MPLVIERSWLGRRVTVRRAVRRDDSDAVRYSDVVGDLVALGEDTAIVDSRRGPVEIALAEVAIARIAPPSTADELALEAVAAAGWRPAETSTLGGWTLRSAGGFTSRANSVLPLRSAGIPLDDALAEAGAWYAERGLALMFQLPTEARRLLDAELGERGWTPSEDVDVLVARLDLLADPGSAIRVEVSGAPDDGWLACWRGGAGLESADARELLVRHERVGFAAVRSGSATLAVGRGVVDGEGAPGRPGAGGWLGVSAVEVDPAHRRGGLATAIMAALWQWGRGQGAVRSYLQVANGNAAAQALYAKLGYWQHHAYRYRTAP